MVSGDIINKIVDMRTMGASITEIMGATGISRATVIKYCKLYGVFADERGNFKPGHKKPEGAGCKKGYQQYPERDALILELSSKGYRPGLIASTLKINVSTVHNVLHKERYKNKN